MKSVLIVLFALCAFSCAYPRNTREDSKEGDTSDAELFIVPLERSEPRHTSFGFGLPEDLVPPPFEQHPFFRSTPWDEVRPGGGEQINDFMTQMQELLNEMRKQLTEMLHHHSHDTGSFPDGNTSVGTRIGEDEIPQNKSTSTTKVIDGHVVTVNETTYSSGDDNIGAVFRIKVVEVVPSETPKVEGEGEDRIPDVEGEGEDEPEEPNKTSHLEPEPTTGKSELEEDKREDHETNEIPNQKVRYQWSPEFDPSLNEIEDPEVFLVDEFTPVKKASYYDLSDDTRVNDYLSDHAESQGLVMIDPDAELIDTNANSYYHYDRVPQRLQRFSN